MRAETGFLAIWSDIAPEHETDYLHWLTREHTAERLGVPGFVSVRVFRARLADARRYFILYRLTDATVMQSDGYLARLNAPTPWSQRIMPRLGNFVRGGGAVIAEAGTGAGGVVSALPVPAPDRNNLTDAIQRLCAMDRIVAVTLFEADQGATGLRTNEKALRTSEGSFSHLLMVEALDDQALRASLNSLSPNLVSGALTYDQIFTLPG